MTSAGTAGLCLQPFTSEPRYCPIFPHCCRIASDPLPSLNSQSVPTVESIDYNTIYTHLHSHWPPVGWSLSSKPANTVSRCANINWNSYEWAYKWWLFWNKVFRKKHRKRKLSYLSKHRPAAVLKQENSYKMFFGKKCIAPKEEVELLKQA